MERGARWNNNEFLKDIKRMVERIQESVDEPIEEPILRQVAATLDQSVTSETVGETVDEEEKQERDDLSIATAFFLQSLANFQNHFSGDFTWLYSDYMFVTGHQYRIAPSGSSSLSSG